MDNWVSKAFIDYYVYLSEDVYCEPIHIGFSVPIWKNPDTPTLDILEIL